MWKWPIPLNVERPARVAAPDMDPGEDVPVVQNANSVVGDDAVNQREKKGVDQALQLLHRLQTSSGARMHIPDGNANGSGGRKHELELPGDLDDEELSERSGVEETNERANNRDGEDGADIIAGVAALSHGACPVQGRDSGDEETRNTTSACRSRLDNGVLLRAEDATDDGQMAAHPRQECEDTVAKDGSKHVRREGESGSET